MWFRSLNERMNYLMEQGSCLWIGRYQLKNLKELMSDVSIALHLTHKTLSKCSFRENVTKYRSCIF